MAETPERANDRQVAGDHYMKHGDLQPWDVWAIWKLNPFQATILKHVVRYQDKMGITDLEKARHYLDKLIELEKEGRGWVEKTITYEGNAGRGLPGAFKRP